MSEEENWKHIAQTILENQYLMLGYIKKHSEDMDSEYKEMLHKLILRTEADIVLRT